MKTNDSWLPPQEKKNTPGRSRNTLPTLLHTMVKKWLMLDFILFSFQHISFTNLTRFI